MQTINRKGRLVETYSLILIDLIAVLGAYMTALLLRFGNVHQAISMQLNYTVGIYMMLFCVLMVLCLTGTEASLEEVFL